MLRSNLFKAWLTNRRLVKFLRWFLLAIVAIVIGFVVLLAVIFNSHSVQRQVANLFIPLLEEQLNAKIELKDIDNVPLKGMFELYGLKVNDQHNQTLLQIDTLQLRFGIWKLLQKQLLVKEAYLHGVDTHLYRDSDSIANYQFILDALKKDAKTESKPKSKGTQLDFDFDRCSIRRLHASWQPGGAKPSVEVKLTELSAKWPVSAIHVNLDSLYIKTDSSKPRKNANKPKRGAFDANHLDAVISAKMDMLWPKLDSIQITVKQLFAEDRASGLRLDSFTTQAVVSPGQIQLDNVKIRSNQTVIHIPEATLQTKPLVIAPLQLTANVQLQDIAQPFAPALSHFTTPLQLSTLVGGTLDSIAFDSIRIQTPDQRLQIRAQGNMTKVNRKHELELSFTIDSMKAEKNVHTEIVNHFSKKTNLKMIDQLNALKRVQYQGKLHIYYKHVAMEGLLSTPQGKVNFDFDLDSNTHFMTGSLSTSGLELGEIMDVAGLGKVSAQAEYHINISNPKNRPNQGGEMGLLPVGTITAQIPHAHYRGVHFRNIRAYIESDGNEAEGSIDLPGQIALGSDFTYRYTNREKDLHVKPRIKISPFGKKKSQFRR